jgi:hypothetical protein
MGAVEATGISICLSPVGETRGFVPNAPAKAGNRPEFLSES